MNFLNDLDDLICESKRLDWHQYFMSVALLIRLRSPSEKLKVGSIIVKNNRIISSGYNGFPSGTPHESITRDGHEINTIHSEQNAISDSACRGVSVDNASIYISHFPCIHCTKYIISCGIKEIYYYNDYKNDDLVYELLKISNIKIEQIKTSLLI